VVTAICEYSGKIPHFHRQFAIMNTGQRGAIADTLLVSCPIVRRPRRGADVTIDEDVGTERGAKPCARCPISP
jgi:hypothetical protein